MNNIDNFFKGIFLLILSISGNFIQELLNCETQKFLAENIYVKHIIAFFILFFSINFYGDEVINPYITFKYSVIIYILFLCFTRMNLLFTIIVMLLLILSYVINLIIKYLDKKAKNNKLKKNLENKLKFIHILIILIIIIGFLKYYYKEYQEHKNDFTILKFIMGVLKCDHINN